MHPFLTEVTRVLGERPMSISELPTIDIKDLFDADCCIRSVSFEP